MMEKVPHLLIDEDNFKIVNWYTNVEYKMPIIQKCTVAYSGDDFCNKEDYYRIFESKEVHYRDFNSRTITIFNCLIPCDYDDEKINYLLEYKYRLKLKAYKGFSVVQNKGVIVTGDEFYETVIFQGNFKELKEGEE